MYLTRKAEAQGAIEAVDECTTLVRHLQSGTGFVQLKGRFDRVTQQLKKSQSKKPAHLYTPLIAGLAQLLSKSDEATIEKILDLLQRLREDLVTGIADDETLEQTQSQDWTAMSAQLTNKKNSLIERKGQLESLVASLTEIIRESEQNLETLRVDLGNLRFDLEETVSWCNEQRATYLSQTAERYFK